eukprot:1986761-Amphidinium_carterae.1
MVCQTANPTWEANVCLNSNVVPQAASQCTEGNRKTPHWCHAWSQGRLCNSLGGRLSLGSLVQGMHSETMTTLSNASSELILKRGTTAFAMACKLESYIKRRCAVEAGSYY